MFDRAFGTAGSRINRFFFTLMWRLERALNILSRTNARINPSVLSKLFERGDVMRAALALNIWSKWSTAIGTFLPVESKPFQIFDHRIGELCLATRAIEVFVAQDERSRALPSALMGRPECPGVAEVQITGWRRSKATAVLRRWRIDFRIDDFGTQKGSSGCFASHSLKRGNGNERSSCTLRQLSELSGGRGAPE